LATPMGPDAGMCSGGVNALIRCMDSQWEINFSHQGSSILPHNFNVLVCEALNHRKSHKLRWFVMLHSDVSPLGDKWLDNLFRLHEEHGADVISVILPIKDGNGLTSTAVDTDRWRPRRLTMSEVCQQPETFGNEHVRQVFGADLLLNTGLLAFRLDNNDWCERVLFNFDCKIEREDNGLFRAYVEPEDWNFSRWCHANGLRLVATRAILCQHRGSTDFINWSDWGRMKTDDVNGSTGGIKLGEVVS